METKMHYNAMGAGLYLPNSAECGANHGEMASHRMTTVASEVTCLRCRKTLAFIHGPADRQQKQAPR